MIPYSTQKIENDDIELVTKALCSSHLTQGTYTEEFESKLCSYTSAKYALSFNSATSALYAAYYAYKEYHQFKEIYAITSPISFVATTNMMLLNDITPLFADVLPDGNIDPKSVEAILESSPHKDKIKMLVSIDYAGKSVEVDSLRAIAKKYNLIYISDSSHACGGSYKGTKIGALADATIFSFHAVKPITTTEGGALLTNDKNIYDIAKKVRSHGVEKKSLWNYDVSMIGFNFRLSDVASALGVSQINKLDRFIAKREKLSQIYNDAFKNDIFSRHFDIIEIPSHISSTHHLYPICFKQSHFCEKESIFSRLQDLGFGVQVHYKPINEFSMYVKRYGDSIIPNAHNFYLSELSIPLHQGMSEQDIKSVIEALKNICL